MSISLPEIDTDDPRWTKRGVIYVPAGEGITKWIAGDVYSVKVHANNTDGRLGFIEASVPPGAGPVAHVHNNASEAFYVLDGELEFLNGDEKITARSGDFLYVPPGVRHRFRNMSFHTTKLLFLFTPGGLEETFIQVGDDPVPGVPAPLWDAARFAKAGEVANRLGGDTDFLPEAA
ncbi:quercetin 2,3-dioxygenase [Catellatospora citrea]|uniref:quercetin 2,3-dioxygenase n=1 Tax=Catellatospora citrea TaxID=53366 RepID=UPI0033CA219D